MYLTIYGRDAARCIMHYALNRHLQYRFTGPRLSTVNLCESHTGKDQFRVTCTCKY